MRDTERTFGEVFKSAVPQSASIKFECILVLLKSGRHKPFEFSKTNNIGSNVQSSQEASRAQRRRRGCWWGYERGEVIVRYQKAADTLGLDLCVELVAVLWATRQLSILDMLTSCSFRQGWNLIKGHRGSSWNCPGRWCFP